MYLIKWILFLIIISPIQKKKKKKCTRMYVAVIMGNSDHTDFSFLKHNHVQ